MVHRCLMCQKRCLIPSKFRATDFEQILRDGLTSKALDAAEDGTALHPELILDHPSDLLRPALLPDPVERQRKSVGQLIS
jgi:hypothetical protein